MAGKEWDYDVRLAADPEAAGLSERENNEQQKLIIGVLADLAGPTGGPGPWHGIPIHKRRFLDVDRDTFDDALSRCRVTWRGGLQRPPFSSKDPSAAELHFQNLDDFHPDRIVQQIPELRALHELLDGLENPSRCDEAAAALARWGVAAEESRPEEVPAPFSEEKAAAPIDRSKLLDAMLERQAPGGKPTSDLDRMVREIVAPHAIRSDSRRQESVTAAVHHTLSVQASAVLHRPDFQALETFWRGLRFLVDSAGDDTKVRIVHLTREELLGDVMAGGSLENSELARLLIEPASIPGSEHFSLLVGAYEFSHDLEDMAVLERLGNVCARLKAPMISAAGPRLLGGTTFEELPPAQDLARVFESKALQPWQMLRRTPAARWVALAAPRILCRLPFGARTQPAETFRFEEKVDGDHAKLAWGNPAFAVAALFAQGFAAEGWDANPAAAVARLEGLPLYQYRVAGELVTEPCAEVLMGEQTVQAFMNGGLLPIVSYRDADMIGFPSLQTFSDPRTPLQLSRGS